MQRKLFVSHSSKTPANLDLLQRVCSGLAHKDFEVLVDRSGQLYAGIDWELRLNEWMAECHAAVILFSTAALRDSDWVKKEAAILSWRRELQKDFTLIPVLLEGVTPEDLEQNLFGVLRILKDQCVRSASDAQEIVDAIACGLGPGKKPTLTPFERIEGVLTTILEKQADTDALQDTWNALVGDNKPQWQPDSGRRFASALTRFMLRERQHATGHLQTVLDKIRPRVDKDAAEELLKYLACLWVDAEAAAGISAAANRGGLMGLNGNYLRDFTARRYGERAWPLSDKWRFIQVDSTQRTVDAIVEVIRETFRPKSLRPDGKRPPAAAIDRRIQRFSDPVLVLIPSAGEPAQIPDSELLAGLRAHFPKLIYIISTGAQVPDWLPEHVEMLMPPLDLMVEEDQYFALDEIKDFINNRLYGSP